MASLFSPGNIGSLRLENRMIRTASHEGLAEADGAPTEAQFEFYKNFITGGIGLVITGYAGIMQNGKSALFRMTMINRDELIKPHKELVDKIHKLNGKIILQIAHCGRQTWSKDTGAPPLVAPSAIKCGFYNEKPKALSEAEIWEIIENFAKAAGRAKTAGYDGVEIHGAHGYLLSTFLSRHSNHRKDRWGGSLENRFRIVGEILKAVKKETGREFPVLIKLNCFEISKKGMKPQECAKVAELVAKTGCCDAIEISAGTNEGGFYMARGDLPIDGILKYLRPYKKMHPFLKFLLKYIASPFIRLTHAKFSEGYNLEAAALVKQASSLPVITVGGMRTKSFMEKAIREGKSDFISMARPLLLEPDLANKFERGESDAARCDNCNICVIAADSVSIACHLDEFKK